MKFIVEKASDWDYKSEVEIETLDELEKFIENCGYEIVINEGFTRITIYDAYIE